MASVCRIRVPSVGWSMPGARDLLGIVNIHVRYSLSSPLLYTLANTHTHTHTHKVSTVITPLVHAQRVNCTGLGKLHVRIPRVCTCSRYKVEDRVRKPLTRIASASILIYMYMSVYVTCTDSQCK
jgi:hypothetical protein